jgi:hypothetical protein
MLTSSLLASILILQLATSDKAATDLASLLPGRQLQPVEISARRTRIDLPHGFGPTTRESIRGSVQSRADDDGRDSGLAEHGSLVVLQGEQVDTVRYTRLDDTQALVQITDQQRRLPHHAWYCQWQILHPTVWETGLLSFDEHASGGNLIEQGFQLRREAKHRLNDADFLSLLVGEKPFPLTAMADPGQGDLNEPARWGMPAVQTEGERVTHTWRVGRYAIVATSEAGRLRAIDVNRDDTEQPWIEHRFDDYKPFGDHWLPTTMRMTQFYSAPGVPRTAILTIRYDDIHYVIGGDVEIPRIPYVEGSMVNGRLISKDEAEAMKGQ